MSEIAITRNVDKLKKELNLPMVFCIGLKQVIGGGVIALTGVAIGITGPSVPIAYLLAAFTSIMAGIPFAILGSAMPVTGGMYTWPTRILSPMTGFLTIWIFFLSNFTLSLYALTAAGYIRVFYPDLPAAPLAFSILTVFYLLNLSGAKATAKVGMILTLIMSSAILLFIFSGLPELNAANFENMLPNGFFALLSATGLLMFTMIGASMVSELGGEMKNPGRDIPITVIGATGVATVVYVLASVVAAGVLPISEVANQPLTLVAERIMSRNAFLYFTIGAGIISILGVINAQMLWGSKSLLVACDDNWLPRKLAGVSKRFGTPHYLLTALYIVGIFPILTGLSIKEIAIASNITAIIAQVVVVVSCFVLYRKHPAIYNRALFKITNRWVLTVIVVVAFALNGFLIISLFMIEAGLMTTFIMLAWLALGIFIGQARKRGVLPNTLK